MHRALSLVEADYRFRWVCRWTTAKRLTSVLNAILILSDSQYKGWQPEKDDLIDIQMGLLYFIDRHGRQTLKETRLPEEGGQETDSFASSIRTSLDAAAVGGVTKNTTSRHEPVPGPNNAAVPLEPVGPTFVQPGPAPGKSGAPGGPPPPDGRFFNDPLNLRTMIIGTGDGYRSPEPPPRLNSLSPLIHAHKDRSMLGNGQRASGIDASETTPERLEWSTFAPQPTAAQPLNGPGPGTEYGYGPPLSSSNWSVLPAELMVYNDLMMDIGTAQYLGADIREQWPIPTDGNGDVDGSNSSTDGYQWQSASYPVMQEPPQTLSSFGYPQQGHPDHTSVEQTLADGKGQWHTGGIADYEWVLHDFPYTGMGIS